MPSLMPPQTYFGSSVMTVSNGNVRRQLAGPQHVLNVAVTDWSISQYNNPVGSISKPPLWRRTGKAPSGLREVSGLVALHYCPVQVYEDWWYVSKVKTGFLFWSITRYDIIGNKPLSMRSISSIIKDRVKSIRLKPKNYSGHSLIAGLATSPEQTFTNYAENSSPPFIRVLSFMYKINLKTRLYPLAKCWKSLINDFYETYISYTRCWIVAIAYRATYTTLKTSFRTRRITFTDNRCAGCNLHRSIDVSYRFDAIWTWHC